MAGEVEAANRLARALAPGERLLWSGAPSPAGVLLANLAAIFGTLIWAGLAGAGFVYALQTHSEAGFAACGTFFALALFAFGESVRAAFSAHHLLYAISTDRILSLDDRTAEPFVVLRRDPEDRMRDAWLDGRAKRGWRHGGRATVKIPYTSFQLGTGKIADGWQKDWLRFVAVERPDEAVALLNGGEPM